MVAVIGKTGKRLMPTTEAKARKLMKRGRAEIYRYKPFTIRMLDREDGYTQEIEYCCDAGYEHIGISIKTEKREIVSEQRDLLRDETEKHRDRRQYRSARRSRNTRHRKPRFDNRKGMICEDGLAPSIRNKRDQHVMLFQMYREVMPITSAVIEVGTFDPQVLAAVEKGLPVPKGLDYQHGPRYGYSTLREAVLARDHHTCQVCGKSIKDSKPGKPVIFNIHHIGFWKRDRTNRMSNLLTVCTKCHSSKNHKKEGKLWGFEPKTGTYKAAAFMNQVRWDLIRRFKEAAPEVEIHVTYGAATKDMRHALHVEKSHATDAWAMGKFHPKQRTRTRKYRKLRRNNRILEKFYDAEYIDKRDGKAKKGAELSCGRTKRCESRKGPQNQRPFRGCRKQKLSKTKSSRKAPKYNVSQGRRSIRRQRYPLCPGDTVWFGQDRYRVKGVEHYGQFVSVEGLAKSRPVRNVTRTVHAGGWAEVQKGR